MSLSTKPAEAKVRAVAQANRPNNTTLELEAEGNADILRRLRATLPTANKMPKGKRVGVPFEDLNARRWQTA